MKRKILVAAAVAAFALAVWTVRAALPPESAVAERQAVDMLRVLAAPTANAERIMSEKEQVSILRSLQKR